MKQQVTMASSEPKKIKRLLIANRGEIACRIIKSCKKLQIESIAIYSPRDKNARHVRLADQAIELDANTAPKAYLDIEGICKIATDTKADAIHPGYGFLSENPEFAKAVTSNGIIFIGPKSASIALSGDKLAAKQLAEKLAVPCIPGIELAESTTNKLLKQIKKFAKEHSYPIMLKAAGGGGGRGMRQVYEEHNLEESLAGATREAQQAFGDSRIFVEKLVTDARHIEVQVIADAHGNVRHLLDRDCSLQRKHQKIIEEAPAYGISDQVRDSMYDAAVQLLTEIDYQSLATVEFLLDPQDNWYFLEINSRLQVEHPVTESILGLDLIQLQIQIAEGQKLADKLPQEISANGHSIECRICAEAAFENFQPASGIINKIELPNGTSTANYTLRFDTGYDTGDRFNLDYDSLVGKLIIHAEDRPTAICAMLNTIAQTSIFGIKTNTNYLQYLLSAKSFIDSKHSVNTADELLSNFEAYQTVLLLSALYIHTTRSKHSFWNTQARNSPAVNNKLWLNIMGSSYQIEIQSVYPEILVKLDSHSLKVEVQNNPNTYTYGGQAFDYDNFNIDSNSCWISCHLGNFYIKAQGPKLKEHLEHANSANPMITSQLPGKVINCLVETGAAVETNQTLITIESMKMEHLLKAPQAGTVKQIHVEAGSIIESGDLLMELEYSTTEHT